MQHSTNKAKELSNQSCNISTHSFTEDCDDDSQLITLSFLVFRLNFGLVWSSFCRRVLLFQVLLLVPVLNPSLTPNPNPSLSLNPSLNLVLVWMMVPVPFQLLFQVLFQVRILFPVELPVLPVPKTVQFVFNSPEKAF